MSRFFDLITRNELVCRIRIRRKRSHPKTTGRSLVVLSTPDFSPLLGKATPHRRDLALSDLRFPLQIEYLGLVIAEQEKKAKSCPKHTTDFDEQKGV
jgi:hypothetical protein